MQKDVKLGLGVGLILLLFCGFFYIKMRSTDTEPTQPADDGMEQILGTDQAKETTPSLEEDLPRQVTPPVVPTEVAVKEQPAMDISTPPVLEAPKVEEPEKPDTIVKIGKSTETVEEKVQEVKEEKVEEKAIEETGPRVPDFPPRPTGKPAVPAPTASRVGEEYVVEPGDSLSGIASEMLGSAKHWRKLYEANKDKLSGPDKLTVGMTLVLPDVSAEPKEEKPAPAEKPALVPPRAPESTADEGDMHVVQKGETLSDIAEFYLNDRNKWKTIAQANPNVDPNRLRIGQKIKIPQH